MKDNKEIGKILLNKNIGLNKIILSNYYLNVENVKLMNIIILLLILIKKNEFKNYINHFLFQKKQFQVTTTKNNLLSKKNNLKINNF